MPGTRKQFTAKGRLSRQRTAKGRLSRQRAAEPMRCIREGWERGRWPDDRRRRGTTRKQISPFRVPPVHFPVPKSEKRIQKVL